MKTCSKCDRRLSLGEFYRESRGTGYRQPCKVCYNAAGCAYARQPEIAARRREISRAKGPRRRPYQPAAAARWARNNRVKKRAYFAVSEAKRKGLLIPRACEECNADTAEAHHDDYSKPLDVRWLCRWCHKDHHRRERTA